MLNPLEEIPATALQILAPSDFAASGWRETVASARAKCGAPFSAERLGFLEGLSGELFRHDRLRRDPAGAALAFWLRRANLQRLEQDFRAQSVPGRRVPAGLVFHIAPGNVDTMFIYSWALSFLAGNANVVRLTSQRSALVGDLLECLNRTLAADSLVRSANLFVSYGHDDATTVYLSGQCDLRIIWGGDETIRRVRSIPLNPHAGERAFASKRSLAIISADRYAARDNAQRRDLAERMAADLVPFAQMACSSPQTVYWFGSTGVCTAACADFENRLETAMAAKIGEPDLPRAVRRINHAFNEAAAGRLTELTHAPHTTHVHARAHESAEAPELCGGGFLAHAMIPSIDAIQSCLRQDHQTITHDGLTPAEIEVLAAVAGGAGVDRVVPIGRALDFGPYWDGFSLWDDLTRIIVVQP